MWLVFNVGCIECGVSSNVVGVFVRKYKADEIAKTLNENTLGVKVVKTHMKFSN